MSWEHAMAQQFKRRDNPTGAPFYIGTVTVPDPLTITIQEGQITLTGKQIWLYDEIWLCHAWEQCTPKNQAPPGCDTCPGLTQCDGCTMEGEKGRCIKRKPFEAGDKVALIGDQVYLVLGRVTQQ